MKIIYKYQLEVKDHQKLRIPTCSKFLDIQVQNNKPTLWYLVDTQEPMFDNTFHIYGTGQEVKNAVMQRYIGTVQIDGFVWHVFEDR